MKTEECEKRVKEVEEKCQEQLSKLSQRVAELLQNSVASEKEAAYFRALARRYEHLYNEEIKARVRQGVPAYKPRGEVMYADKTRTN